MSKTCKKNFLLRLADPSGTGLINYEEFIEVLKAQNASRSIDSDRATSPPRDLTSSTSWASTSRGETSQTDAGAKKAQKKKKKVQVDIVGGG